MNYTAEELARVLESHGKWLRGERDGTRADLTHANLSDANLTHADLTDAILDGADLRRAILRDAILRNAILIDAILQGADLRRANLRGANLRGARLREARLGDWSIVPTHGAFEGWKKLSGGVIARLSIPHEARRMSSLIGRKCRAEYVDVIELRDKYSSENVAEAVSLRGAGLTYRPGKRVIADWYDDDIRIECTHGIHFFITLSEAEGFSFW